MTEEHYKRLIAMLLDTLDAQHQQITALEAQLAAASKPVEDGA